MQYWISCFTAAFFTINGGQRLILCVIVKKHLVQSLESNLLISDDKCRFPPSVGILAAMGLIQYRSSNTIKCIQMCYLYAIPVSVMIFQNPYYLWICLICAGEAFKYISNDTLQLALQISDSFKRV